MPWQDHVLRNSLKGRVTTPRPPIRREDLLHQLRFRVSEAMGRLQDAKKVSFMVDEDINDELSRVMRTVSRIQYLIEHVES